MNDISVLITKDDTCVSNIIYWFFPFKEQYFVFSGYDELVLFVPEILNGLLGHVKNSNESEALSLGSNYDSYEDMQMQLAILESLKQGGIVEYDIDEHGGKTKLDFAGGLNFSQSASESGSDTASINDTDESIEDVVKVHLLPENKVPSNQLSKGFNQDDLERAIYL